MANWDNQDKFDKSGNNPTSNRQKIAIIVLVLIGIVIILSIVLPLVLT